MSSKQHVFILSSERWLFSLLMATWVYLGKGRDIYLVNPLHLEKEKAHLAQLARRLPVYFTDATGSGLHGALKGASAEEFAPSLPG